MVLEILRPFAAFARRASVRKKIGEGKKTRRMERSTLCLLSESQGGTNVLAAQLDAQGTLQLSENLLVGNSTSSLIVVNLKNMLNGAWINRTVRTGSKGA